MKAGPKTSIAIHAQVLAQFDSIIDVRSPAEYAEDHVPGALSCPVLDDAEQVRVERVLAEHVIVLGQIGKAADGLR